MAKQFQVPIAAGYADQHTKIVNADGTTAKTIFTAGSNDANIIGIHVSSTDSADRTFIFSITDGTTIVDLGAVLIPLGAGRSVAVPAVNIMTSLAAMLVYNSVGNLYLPMLRARVLTATLTASAVTAATEVRFRVIAEDFTSTLV
jgi:hypothetical protein